MKAWKEGRRFPGYVWMTYEWDNSEGLMWWENSYSPSSSNCSDAEMALMVERMLVVSHYNSRAEEQGDSDSFVVDWELISPSVGVSR
jgi:hypothetical protein